MLSVSRLLNGQVGPQDALRYGRRSGAGPRRLSGRCARCRFAQLCNGGLPVRAESATGDPGAPDPACYLTDGEIQG